LEIEREEILQVDNTSLRRGASSFYIVLVRKLMIFKKCDAFANGMERDPLIFADKNQRNTNLSRKTVHSHHQ
jgi:hypothetical protein